MGPERHIVPNTEPQKYAWSVVGDGGVEVPRWLCEDGMVRLVVASPDENGEIKLVLTTPIRPLPVEDRA